MQLGNLTHVYEYDDEEAEDPYRTKVTSYCPNLTDWIVDRATTSNVYAGDAGGTLESSTHYIYGQDTDPPSGPCRPTARVNCAACGATPAPTSSSTRASPTMILVM